MRRRHAISGTVEVHEPSHPALAAAAMTAGQAGVEDLRQPGIFLPMRPKSRCCGRTNGKPSRLSRQPSALWSNVTGCAKFTCARSAINR